MSNTATQSNTREGSFPAIAGEDLRGMEGRVALLKNATGKAVANLPASIADETPYLILDGGNTGETILLAPLEPGRNFRAYVVGAVVTGDALGLAGVAGANVGKLTKLAVATGEAARVGIAEESAPDGGLVLFRSAPAKVASGDMVALAGENLTGKEGRLVVAGNSAGSLAVSLPAATTDDALYVLIAGDTQGKDVIIRPLTTASAIQSLATGAVVPGDQLVLAAINGTLDGMLIALPVTNGTYQRIGIAEAASATGTLATYRHTVKTIVVSN